MTMYVLRRALSSVVVALLVSMFVFLAINAQDGSVIEANLAGSGIVSKEEVDALRQQLKLDRSPIERYYTWWHDIILGCDEGQSVCYGNSLRVRGVSVWSRVGDALPYTIELLVLALLISFLVAIPVGVVSALRQDRLVDYVLRVFAILGVAVPGFFLATLVVIYGSRWFNYAPPPRIPALWDDPISNIKAFIPPALLLGYSLSAVKMRMTRSALLEVLRQDYIRTARAKGLRERRVIAAHAFRNAFIPVLTLVGNQAGSLLGGSVIAERIFNIRGMGWLAFQAISDRDYTQVLATTLVLTGGVILINLLVDLSYAAIDPRIKYT
jgi:peptide/nickel transport system permease protein